MTNTSIPIEIYTDGSSHTQKLIGAWAAIIYYNDSKIIIKQVVVNTNHNRMEMQAVIQAIKFVDTNYSTNIPIIINSDSQYVVNLVDRKEKLKKNEFMTRKGNPVKNLDLVITLIDQIETHEITFNKIKAHVKDGDIKNREVDLLVRKLMREHNEC
jgi:ribonuclease HI